MAIRKKLLDELIATSGSSLIGPDGLVKELTKALVERNACGRDEPSAGASEARGNRQRERVVPFFDFPDEIRKIIYTTNAVESLHMTLREVTKNRGSFPTRDAAIKLIYLAAQNASKKWNFVQGWREALQQFTIR